ncbi:MAG: L,D-transpeptidase family protein [Cyanobacteria bacterium J06598_1]
MTNVNRLCNWHFIRWLSGLAASVLVAGVGMEGSAIATSPPIRTADAFDLTGTEARSIGADKITPTEDLPARTATESTESRTLEATNLLDRRLEQTSSPVEDSVSQPPQAANTSTNTSTGSSPKTPPSQISETLKLELRLSERRLSVYRGEMLVANYTVAVGREGWQTPTGEFRVFQKQSDPSWEHPFTGEVIPPGPENPLGTRWIGFWSDGQNSIGFHGTPDESVIGSAVSHGCVRMRNEDVLALYEQVSMDTPVIVLP